MLSHENCAQHHEHVAWAHSRIRQPSVSVSVQSSPKKGSSHLHFCRVCEHLPCAQHSTVPKVPGHVFKQSLPKCGCLQMHRPVRALHVPWPEQSFGQRSAVAISTTSAASTRRVHRWAMSVRKTARKARSEQWCASNVAEIFVHNT